MKKKIGSFIIAALVLASLYFMFPLHKNGHCDWQADFDKKTIYGIVKRKFYDRSNHSVPLVILTDIKNKSIDSIDFMGDTSLIFDKLKELDTVYKKANSNEILLRANGRFKKVGDVVFSCN